MKPQMPLGLLALTFNFTGVCEAVECDPVDSAFVCGINNAEDLVRLPGTPWIVASQANMAIGPGDPPSRVDPVFGPLQVVSMDTRQVYKLYPAADSGVDWDREAYPRCHTPPKSLTAGGLNVRQLEKHAFRVYAVNHGDRQSVEIIDVNTQGEHPRAMWRGCILAPREELEIAPNAVAPLPGGGLILSGYNLASWQPGGEWKRVQGWKGIKPGAYDAAAKGGNANGVEVSSDGRYVFIADDSAARAVIRVPIDGGVAQQIRIHVNFFPDNLRWGGDGKLYVAGPDWSEGFSLWTCLRRPICDVGFAVAQIDPQTLSVREIYRSGQYGVKGKFGAVTVALQADGQLWIGTVRGDRIMVLPLSGPLHR